jgi:hypothetical protein
VGNLEGLSVLSQPRRETLHPPRNEAETSCVIFLAELKDDLGSQADSKDGLPLLEEIPKTPVEAGGSQIRHGLPGRADPRENNALGFLQFPRIAGDFAGLAQVVKGARNACQVPCAIVYDGYHSRTIQVVQDGRILT